MQPVSFIFSAFSVFSDRWWLGLLLVPAMTDAAEMLRRDVLVAAEALPTAFDYSIMMPSGSRAGSDSFARAYGGRLGLRLTAPNPGSLFAWVGGFEGRASQSTYGDSSSYKTYSVGGTVGVAIALSDRVSFTVEPLVELGKSYLDMSDGSGAFEPLQAAGNHFAYGARAEILFGLSRRWWLGLDAGLLREDNSLSAGDDRTFDLKRSGAVVSLVVIWRWDAAPSLLE